MKSLIIPAIIAKTQSKLDEILDKIVGKFSRVMLDFMDGEFVPNKSLDFDFKLFSGFEYEAHLMVRKPLDWIRRIEDKVDVAILHMETLQDIEAEIDYVKNRGLKVTLAINPETKVECVFPYLDEVYCILVMTVVPGKYGGEFLQETLEKVKTLREIDGEIQIEVDGGMNPKNARLAKIFGANVFASGSYLLQSENIDEAIRRMRESIS